MVLALPTLPCRAAEQLRRFRIEARLRVEGVRQETADRLLAGAIEAIARSCCEGHNEDEDR